MPRHRATAGDTWYRIRRAQGMVCESQWLLRWRRRQPVVNDPISITLHEDDVRCVHGHFFLVTNRWTSAGSGIGLRALLLIASLSDIPVLIPVYRYWVFPIPKYRYCQTWSVLEALVVTCLFCTEADLLTTLESGLEYSLSLQHNLTRQSKIRIMYDREAEKIENHFANLEIKSARISCCQSLTDYWTKFSLT